MSDTSASTQGGQGTTSGATPAAGDEFKPIASQEELNRLIEVRLQRERAKFADYKDVKAKADRLDEIEAANKSELDKAKERADAAEREREQAKAEALRWRVAAKHGISDEDAELFLTGTDEATLTKQAERLAGRVADRKKNGNVVPKEGAAQGQPRADEMREFTRQVFARSE